MALSVCGYEVRSIVLTRFRLDGGAMFGSVPRVLWERRHPADERNRIGLAARVLMLRGHGRCAIVDAGLGEKFGPRESEMYAVSSQPVGDQLRWEELTDVVLTHLHFDHAGGITVPGDAPIAGEGGVPARLRAPRARMHLQARNWERARSPGPREKASYLPENVLPLEKGSLVLWEGEAEVLPGVTVHPSDGHTRGLQWVKVGEGKDAVVFPADVVPTSTHVHLPFVMGYDMCVETLLAEKENLLARAAGEGWTLVYAHDETLAASRIRRGADGKFTPGEAVAV